MKSDAVQAEKQVSSKSSSGDLLFFRESGFKAKSQSVIFCRGMNQKNQLTKLFSSVISSLELHPSGAAALC